MTPAGWRSRPWGARGLWICAALALLVLLVAPLALAAPGPAERSARGFVAVPSQEQADRLDMAFEIQADGSVVVTETIRWRFPDGEERHGILRNVQVRAGYQDRPDTYRYYELSGVSAVSPSGAPTDIAVSDFGAFRQIRIGSPSLTIRGSADYVVTYRLEHIVNDIGDGTAEFYYDIVDPSNAFPQRQVTSRVTAPVASTRAACFYGELGATTPCAATPGPSATFAVPDLAAGEGASVVASFPRSAFGDLTPDLREGSATSSASSPVSPRVATALGWLAIGVGVLLPLLAAGLMGLLVWHRGRDEQYAGLTPGLSPGHGEQVPVVVGGARPSVAVQFTPPAGVQPGLVGTVLDESADIVDVSSTVVDLAVRGHLRIARDDKGILRADDWVLTRLAPPPGSPALSPYEQVLHDALFASGDTVALSALKNTFRPTVDAVQRLMYEEVVQRGWFRRSPDAQRSGWMVFGLVVSMISLFVGIFAVGPSFVLFADADVPIPPIFVLAGGGVVTGLIIRSIGRRMAARTAEGSAVLAQSQGFERYIATAESNQIRWEEAQDVFSRFLPFAIVFGLADRWASVFEEVAEAAARAGHLVAGPAWYSGDWGTGGFGDVAASMDSFSTVAAGTFVSTPGSSGSSGFSGGGGSSGGGGGGSSGGSW